MTDSYTIYNHINTLSYPSTDDIDDAVDFLKNRDSFRPFHKGLLELLQKKGFSGQMNHPEEAANYLVSRLRAIHSSIGTETVASWCLGTHRPKVEAGSRKKIYEICFALNLSYEETLWFFQHVYYDRAFNCHLIGEAVYCYAFQHRLSYDKARKLIKEIQAAPASSDTIGVLPDYTRYIQNRIHELGSTEELKSFLIQHKSNFNSWNLGAQKTLDYLVTLLLGSKDSKDIMEQLKRRAYRKQRNGKCLHSPDFYTPAEYQNCGLLIKEILFDSKTQNTYPSAIEYFLDSVSQKNVHKNTFLLERLLSSAGGMKKNTDIPYIVRNNFPSKKTLSEILDQKKLSFSKSYDSIRKVIILLDFYRFWASVKLGIGYTDLPDEALCEIYVEEANACLYQCGYENLYAGNPYDWIFLCSSQGEEPLAFFRGCMAEILPDDFYTC